jgi:hypothetical protein
MEFGDQHAVVTCVRDSHRGWAKNVVEAWRGVLVLATRYRDAHAALGATDDAVDGGDVATVLTAGTEPSRRYDIRTGL